MLNILSTRKGRIFTSATAAALVVGFVAGHFVFDSPSVTTEAAVTSSESRFPASIALNKTELKLSSGQTATLAATVMPDDADNTTVQWVSDDRSVVAVDNGNVEAVGAGITQVTATTLNGKQAVCTVTVSDSASVPSAASNAQSSNASSASSSSASSSAPAPVVIL